ncbi:MAG: RNA polymerase subunit sigma-24 [Acidimicrobiia bacterium]|nr:RNA polymerase subunit sigma-24 [Acidimicrobiia bacterium]
MTSTSDRSSKRPELTIEEIYRAEWGRLQSLLVSRTRRLDLAEDALSEAFARAAQRWPADGVPANPAGWLYTTAHRQVVGRLRAEAIAGRKAPLLAVRPEWVLPGDPLDELADDRLQLILLCCHPALPQESRSGLALRLVIGTPTEQIARLFLVSPATMAARLTRAKKKIVLVGIPLGAPVEEELRSRLDEVCRTIYLAFTAGYAPGAGPDLLRADLSGEAVRLAAILHDLVPDALQVQATLALLVLQHSRRDARERNGHLVTLAEQDRSLWHHHEIRAGLGLVSGLARGEGYAEELRLQALIAAEHARAPTAQATDWPAIAGHYADLERRTGSAIVRLNRAVAVGEAEGPRAGLALLTELGDLLSDNHRVAAVRAELAQRAGDFELARASFRTAIDLCSNDVERSHLRARLAGSQHP